MKQKRPRGIISLNLATKPLQLLNLERNIRVTDSRKNRPQKFPNILKRAQSRRKKCPKERDWNGNQERTDDSADFVRVVGNLPQPHKQLPASFPFDFCAPALAVFQMLEIMQERQEKPRSGKQRKNRKQPDDVIKRYQCDFIDLDR